MPDQIGYFASLKSAAGKVFTYLASITLDGTDGKIITVTQDTDLDEAVAMSSKVTKGGSGQVVNTTLPAFLATSAAQLDKTGDGTLYTVEFTTEIFDQGANYDGAYLFTAPVTGKYQLQTLIFINGLVAATDDIRIQLVTSNRTYYNDTIYTAGACPATRLCPAISILADMDANDTAMVQIIIAGGTKVVDILTNSWFSGHLVC